MDGFDFYEDVDSDWDLDSTNGSGKEEGGGADTSALGWSADHILVLVDCGASMWDGLFADPEFPDPDEDLLSPVDKVMAVLTEFLKKEIRNRETWKTGRRNGFGVYLFNTRAREHVDWDDSPLKQRQRAIDAAATQEATINDAVDDPSKKHGTLAEENNGEQDESDDDEDDDEGAGGYMVNRASTVHQLIPMEPPGIATIQTLKAVQDDGIAERAMDLQEAYGPKEDDDQKNGNNNNSSALQTAFMMAGRILQEAKCVHDMPKEGRRPDRVRIWIMTNNDETGDFAKASAKDLIDRDYEIVLWPLPHPQKSNFDYHHKKDGRTGYESMSEFIQHQAPGWSKDELMKWWESEPLSDELDVWKTVRPIHRLPMLWPGETEDIGDDENQNNSDTIQKPFLQLHWYRLVTTASRPNPIKVHQETGRQLKTMTQIVEKESNSQEILFEKVAGDMESQPKVSPRLSHYVELQGTRIPLSPEERAQLKSKSHPHKFASLRVIGFRPADSIDRTTASLEPPYFCMPPTDSESRVRGSRPAFAALHRAMTSKKALMLGEVLTRSTATTRLVAAWPLAEKVEAGEEDEEEEDQQDAAVVRPAGLLVIVLPFYNEVKKKLSDAATSSPEPLASESLVQEAKAIVNGVTISPTIGVDFPNKSLEIFWDKLEEIALNERKPAWVDENAITQKDVVKRVGDHLERFIELLPSDPEKVPKKRVREIVPDDSGVDWIEAYENDDLEKHKVDQLKSYLRSVGEKTTGKKQELIDRMKPHLERALKGEPLD